MTEDNAGPLQGSPATDRLRAVGRRRQEAEDKLQQFQQQSQEKAAAEDAGEDSAPEDSAPEDGAPEDSAPEGGDSPASDEGTAGHA